MRPDFSKRQKKLQELMKEKNVDAVLLTNNDDIYYYTGYRGLAEDRIFAVSPADGKPKLIVTPLENEAIIKYRNTVFIDSVKDFIKELKGYRRLGYDEKQLSAVLFSELGKLKIKLRPFGKFLEIPRMVKDAYEIEQIKKAIKITGKIFENIGNNLVGKSESQIANKIDIEFRKHGVANAFESIVSSGPQGAYVHHRPNERVVRSGDMVLVDIGCKVNGYCSDIARMFCKRWGSKEKQIYEDVKEIHDEIAGNIRVNVAYMDIEKLHRKLFKKKGYRVVHGFGHGVGLSVHDPVGKTLKENMVLTVEPGIYIKNRGGFRIEDMVLVKRGKSQILSGFIPSL